MTADFLKSGHRCLILDNKVAEKLVTDQQGGLYDFYWFRKSRLVS